jgi:hypothetical protein
LLISYGALVRSDVGDWISQAGDWVSDLVDWLNAERLTAIGTVGATGFAAVAAWSGVRERRRAREQNRREQARQVHLTAPSRLTSHYSRNQRKYTQAGYSVTVVNESAEVISKCDLVINIRGFDWIVLLPLEIRTGRSRTCPASYQVRLGRSPGGSSLT